MGRSAIVGRVCLAFACPCLLAVAGCGAAPVDAEETVGSTQQRGVCGTNDMQSVGNYVDREGISRAFIDAHQGPSGRLGKKAGSATLIGDGLVLTAAHVDADPGSILYMNLQLDENSNTAGQVLFPVLERVEMGDSEVDDWKILRVAFSPENRFGAATLADRKPIAGEKIVFIGHPQQQGQSSPFHNPDLALGLDTTFKVADVGTIEHVSTIVSTYRSLDIRGVASGGGVYNADGRLLALIKASTIDGVAYDGPSDCTHDDNAIEGNATHVTTVFANSSTIQGARGSGHFFASDTGTADVLAQYSTSTSNWDGDWSHMVRGNFNGGSTDDFFFYSANRGVGRFFTMSPTGGLLVVGSVVNSMSKTWSQIIPVDLDGSGTTELLMYDANNRFGSFYGTDGAGHLTSEIKRNTGWQNGWRIIVSGNFTTRSGNELLFYGPNGSGGGSMALYGMNSTGTISSLSNPTISEDASIIVVGKFVSTNGLDDILVYSPQSGRSNIYQFQGNTPVLVSSLSTARNVTQIVAGDFGTGNPGDDLLYYTPSQGRVEVYSVLDNTLSLQKTQSNLRANFSKMLSGNFRNASAGSEVMFYDRFRLGN